MTTTPNEPYQRGHATDLSDPTVTAGPPQAPPVTGRRTSDGEHHDADDVKEAATGAVQEIAGTAKEQGKQVATDVRDQARRLTREARSQLDDQMTSQRDRAVTTLRSMSVELRTMADSSDQSGTGSRLARQGAEYAQQLADFVARRDPGELVDEVRGFARRRPGKFLLGAAAAGVIVGRLTRGAVDARGDGGAPLSAPQRSEMPQPEMTQPEMTRPDGPGTDEWVAGRGSFPADVDLGRRVP